MLPIRQATLLKAPKNKKAHQSAIVPKVMARKISLNHPNRPVTKTNMKRQSWKMKKVPPNHPKVSRRLQNQEKKKMIPKHHGGRRQYQKENKSPIQTSKTPKNSTQVLKNQGNLKVYRRKRSQRSLPNLQVSFKYHCWLWWYFLVTFYYPHVIS